MAKFLDFNGKHLNLNNVICFYIENDKESGKVALRVKMTSNDIFNILFESNQLAQKHLRDILDQSDK